MSITPKWIITIFFLFLLIYVGTTVLYQSPEFVMPFMLSIMAGLSTTLGSFIVICRSTPLTSSHLAYTCGLAMGVMCFVALFDMFIPAWVDEDIGPFLAITLFTLGGITITIGLRFLPEIDHMDYMNTPENNPQDTRMVYVQPMDLESGQRSSFNVTKSPESLSSTLSRHDRMRTLRFGLLTAIVLGIHNLPEGLAVFISSLDSIRHGILMAIAIALHNIPEGLVIAVPTYAATGDKHKAVWWTLLSGCSEPLGALLALTLLRPYLDRTHIIMLLSFVGGIMFAVCCTELYPEGIRYRRPRPFAAGIISGVIVMAITFVMLEG